MNRECLEKLADDPETDAVHHPYTAWCQGYDAAEFGFVRQLNPYEDKTRERFWWYLGWDEYQEQLADDFQPDFHGRQL
jgi:hypothetical protein